MLLLLCAIQPAALRAERPPRPRRVASYSIRAHLDAGARTVRGEITPVWRNATFEPVEALWFHLPRATRLFSLTREDGRELERAEGRSPLVARFVLPAPVAPGETISLRLEFETRLAPQGPPEYFQAQFWHPQLAALGRKGRGWDLRRPPVADAREMPFDFADFQVALTLPRSYRAAAGGRRMSRPLDNRDDTVTVAWHAQSVRSVPWFASPRLLARDETWSFSRFLEGLPAERASSLRVLAEEAGSEAPQGEVSLRLLYPADHDALAPRMIEAAGWALAGYGLRLAEFPHDSLALVDLPAGVAATGRLRGDALIAFAVDRTAPRQGRDLEWSVLAAIGRRYARDEAAWQSVVSGVAEEIHRLAWGPRRLSQRFGALRTSYADPFLPGPTAGWNGLWRYLEVMPALHLDRGVPRWIRTAPDGVLPATSLQVAVEGARQRAVGEGWEWTIDVRCDPGFPGPLEVWAEDERGEAELLGTVHESRTFTVIRPRQLRAARLGPGWVDRIDSRPFDNALLAEGTRDLRPATLLSWRFLLYLEERLRMGVGVNR